MWCVARVEGGRPAKVRIYTASMGTQLLVIQHLRKHLELPPAREYLLWCPIYDIPQVGDLMSRIIAGAGFDGGLDLRGV